MTATKRKARRKTGGGTVDGAAAPAAQPGQAPGPATPQRAAHLPLHPRSGSAFIGLELGIVAGVSDNSTLQLILFAVTAMFLGFGMSRLVSAWLMRKNWVKPRPKRR
jgi:hypothetical protein